MYVKRLLSTCWRPSCTVVYSSSICACHLTHISFYSSPDGYNSPKSFLLSLFHSLHHRLSSTLSHKHISICLTFSSSLLFPLCFTPSKWKYFLLLPGTWQKISLSLLSLSRTGCHWSSSQRVHCTQASLKQKWTCVKLVTMTTTSIFPPTWPLRFNNFSTPADESKYTAQRSFIGQVSLITLHKLYTDEVKELN